MVKTCLYIALTGVLILGGCTQIAQMEPTSGPPGTPVYVKCGGMFGDPAEQSIKWDGKTLHNPFSGSFVVPADSEAGKHHVTLVDNLDASEAFLIFPIFRMRHDTETFTVTSR